MKIKGGKASHKKLKDLNSEEYIHLTRIQYQLLTNNGNADRLHSHDAIKYRGGGGGGASNFSDLADVPAYAGKALQFLRVKAAEDGLEVATGAEVWSHADLNDMPDISGTNTDHDARYYTETETDTLTTNHPHQDVQITAGPSFVNVIIASIDGIDYTPSSDVDVDLITVNVTGTPKFWWNEATDSFEMNKSLTLPGGSLKIGNYVLSEDTTDNDGLEYEGAIHAHSFGGVSGNICFHEGTEPTVSVSGDGHRIWADSSGNLLVQDSLGVSNVIFTGVPDTLISPDGLKNFSLSGDNLIYNDGTENRLRIDSATSVLYSPDHSSYIQSSNSATRVVVNGYIRFNINSSTAYMRSNDGTNKVVVKGASIAIEENSKQRVYVDNLVTELYSPSRLNYLKVYNSGLLFVHAGNNRFKVDGNYTQMLSPGGGNLNIGNDGLFYSGAIVQTSAHKGVANGIAELDASGIVPVSQLPAYVDAIDEYATLAALISADPQEANKVYITVDDNKVFRYTGTSGSYAEISSTLVIGTTSTTAYRGDRGLIAYDHSQSAHSYEPINANIVKATAGVLPALDGSNLTNIAASEINQIISPDGLKDLSVANINLLYSDGNYARIYIDSTESRLTAPDGQGMIQVKNADFNFKDGTRDRIEADAIGTTLRSTTGAYISLLGNTFLFSDNTRSRIIVSDAESRLSSPDGTNALIMSDASAYITSDLGVTGNVEVTGKTEIIKDGESLKFVVATAGSKHYIAWYASNGSTREAWFGFGSSANYDFTLRNEKANHNINLQITGTGTIVMNTLPTSSAGLPSGGLWKSGGYVRIV